MPTSKQRRRRARYIKVSLATIIMISSPRKDSLDGFVTIPVRNDRKDHKQDTKSDQSRVISSSFNDKQVGSSGL